MYLARKAVRNQFVKAQAAALEALYVPAEGTATQLRIERRLTMAPPPFFARTGAYAPGTVFPNLRLRFSTRSRAHFLFSSAFQLSSSVSGRIFSSVGVQEKALTIGGDVVPDHAYAIDAPRDGRRQKNRVAKPQRCCKPDYPNLPKSPGFTGVRDVSHISAKCQPLRIALLPRMAAKWHPVVIAQACRGLR